MTLLLAVALQLSAAQLPPDSVDTIRKSARRAEARFERLARTLAPLRWGSEGGDCDEIVGRFCLTYDEGRLPEPEPEPSRVTEARREVIEALRHAFSYEADRLETTGPLVRYLVEDDRAAEAVSAARTYALLSADSVWGPLLLGFALHAAADDSAAEREFDAGLARLDPAERRGIEDVEWILSPRDRGVYRDLEDAARPAAEAKLWRHSDPLYLTPGNERRAEHIARRVWSRVLAMSPVVAGMPRWGKDLEEITVRYGVPAARTRTWGTIYRGGSLVEHFDPDQLAFVQEDLLSRGPAPTPPPGESWALEEPRSRSGFAPRTIRRLIALDHQVTRIPAGPGAVVFRVDGRMVMDSVATGASSIMTGLWLLDGETLDELEQTVSTSPVSADTASFGLEVLVSPGDRIYSLEGVDTASGMAARARYAVEVPVYGDLSVSDPLIAAAFPANAPPQSRTDPALRPAGSLVFRHGDEVGLYAEVVGLGRAVDGVRRYEVELSIRDADRAAFPARALSWLGRRLGLSSERKPPRVAWIANAPEEGPAVLAINLKLDDLGEGLHALVLSVTDLASGAATESLRVVRIER